MAPDQADIDHAHLVHLTKEMAALRQLVDQVMDRIHTIEVELKRVSKMLEHIGRS